MTTLDSLLEIGTGADLDRDEFQALLSRGSVPIPLVNVPVVLDLDGYSRGWEFVAIFQEIRIAWHVEGPDEWRGFTDWVEELQDYLDRRLFPTGPPYDLEK